jgi:glycosyltransferase involved in cell wall biosynthesis/CDP-glycerol glycerophosphotransferase (TagB/SpsB family)
VSDPGGTVGSVSFRFEQSAGRVPRRAVGPRAPAAKEDPLVAVPSISVVVPTYNVAAYLPAFLASLDEQDSRLDPIEFVFVNDGSTDESEKIISDWLAARSLNARIVTKPNGGLSSARNAGIDDATGDWVTFIDPDDVLDAAYLGVMHRFAISDEARSVHIIAGNIIFLDDETGILRNRHPLRFRFTEGDRVADLERHPFAIHVSGATGLLRRAVLNKYGLRYDGRVRPVWEDGHLVARYLAKFERPRVATMASAKYYYRRRTDGSSLMQGAWANPAKFTEVPRWGWLDALRIAETERGRVPLWLQNMVLYDLWGYFQRDRQSPSPTAGIPSEVTEEFYAILDEVMPYLDLAAIESYRVGQVPHEVRRAVMMGLKGAYRRPTEIVADELDAAQGLVRLRYFYLGDAPVEQFRARGFLVRPVYEKRRESKFFGRTLMWERIVWMPANGSISVQLDGEAIPLRVGAVDDGPPIALTAQRLWLDMTGEPLPARAPKKLPGLRPRAGRVKRKMLTMARVAKRKVTNPSREGAITRARARTAWEAHRFKNAWLLIDRDTAGQDNAEHLYRYLRDHQPQVNAWFVLARTSKDWDRLSADGFRLIQHGSREHKVALLHCDHLISSQIDNYITNPLSKRYGEGHWRYTFLQHGVTKDDLSIWINPKPISLMITATPDEHESIVGAGSPYVFSQREVKMTGFPRHDRLLSMARETTAPARKMLIMPTWRRGLLLQSVAGGNDRALRDDFWDSEYALQWRAVLESERLHKVADEQGWTIEFIPHPNMQRYLDHSPLPSHISMHRFGDIDVQRMLVSGGALVTDYSSLAFEMAYLERPVVYFQFDRDTFFNGGHAYRRGTWDYEKDGFGPVTLDPEAAITAIADVMQHDGEAEPVYAKRMVDTFPFRDGECSRRTYEAIRDITRPLSYDELFLRLEPEDQLAGIPVEVPED